MKKVIVGVAVILLALALTAFALVTFFPQSLLPFVLKRQLNQQNTLNDQNQALLEDTENIYVITVGTASPIPGPRAQTGTAVIVNGHFFMFDAGDGVVRKAEELGLPFESLNGIFITHWHSDHMMDLPSLISRSWLMGRNHDLHFYGPSGTNDMSRTIDQFLRIENGYRLAHHGEEIMDTSKAKAIPHEFVCNESGVVIVYEKDGIRIKAFEVNHEPIEPAVGYALEYKGKKVVISGDTKKNDLVAEMAEGADLLLHEVILSSLFQQLATELRNTGNQRNAKIITDIQDYHTDPGSVAELAARSNVKKLVLHHFAPSPDLRIIRNLYAREMKAYDGPIYFANDGDRFIVR
jgi:ribonuclease Z